MKNQKLILLILFIVLFIPLHGLTQTPPTIKCVTFDFDNDSTTIVWKAANDSASVDYYSIHRYNPMILAWDSVTVAGKDDRELTFYSISEKSTPAQYVVMAEILGVSQSGFIGSHTTMHSYIEFDSCQSILTINWTRYIGWGSSLFKYTIYQSINGSGWNIIADTIPGANNPTEIWNRTLTNIDENFNYCFYIEAITFDSKKSTSNKSCQDTDMKIRPDYINADYASVSSDNQINLSFTIDPNSEINRYKLLCSLDDGNTFDTIEDIITNEQVLKLIDNDVSTETKSYTYQLAAINSCGNIAVRSNLAVNIVLNVNNEGSVNTLAWNDYQDWNGDLESYAVYRVIDGNASDLIATTATNFNDNIESFQYKQISGQFCYYIEATEGDDNPYGIKGTSKSNTACITLDPIIQIPNAFNPASEISANRCFKPFISYKPSSFSLVIYNRWGGVVFESNNYSNGWDGKFQGNKYAPEGAYIYIIKIVKPNDEVIRKEGNLVIVYP